MYEYKYLEDYKYKYVFVGYKEVVFFILFWKY